MLFVVAFVLHKILPLQLLAVKVAVSVPQILVLSAMIVGLVGLVPVRITTEFDDETLPQVLLQVAV